MTEFLNKVALYDELYKACSGKSFIDFIAKAEEVLPLLTPPSIPPPAPSYRAVLAPSNSSSNTVHFPSSASVASDEPDFFADEGKVQTPNGELTGIFVLSGIKSATLLFQMMRDYYRLHPERFSIGGGHTSGGEEEPHVTITVDYDIRDANDGKALKTHNYRFHAYYKGARSPKGLYKSRVFTHLTGFSAPDNTFITAAVFHASDWASS
jgi:hypothetical protein